MKGNAMSDAVVDLRTAASAAPQRVIEAAHADIPTMKYGSRLRLGMMVPSVNSNAEAHIGAMLPDDVTLHTTRLKMDEKDSNSMLGFIDRIEEASALPPGRRLPAHPGQLHRGHDRRSDHRDAHCRAHPAATGLPSTTTGDGVIAALRALNARKVVMLTPYNRAVNEREVRFLEHYGFKVLDWEGLELNGAQEFDDVTPEQWHDLVRAHRNDATDAYFVSCAQTRVVEVIGAIERDLGRPVITSNQAATWYALRQRGISDPVRGFGTLMMI